MSEIQSDDKLVEAHSDHPVSERDALLKAAAHAAATIAAIYEWLERVEKAGGATSISGISACHAMLQSLRKNAPRTEKLVMEPLRAALAAASGERT